MAGEARTAQTVILSEANPRSGQCLLRQATIRVAEPITELRKHLGGGSL